MNKPAPFEDEIQIVRPEWIDYNGHLNMAYYNVMFDHCVDAAFGLGSDYVREHQTSLFTVEAHITYARELKEGDRVRVNLQVLDYDEKRVHFFQQMYNATEGYLAATAENMCVHVDMKVKKTAPMTDHMRTMIRDMYEAHKILARPPQVGSVIGIPRKN